MSSAEDDLAAHASGSLDAFLRALDEQIASIELRDIPRAVGQQAKVHPAIEALAAQVEQLCTQRAINTHEQQRWMVESERAIRAGDDEHAQEALARHAEHLRLAQEADAMLAEFRILIADVQRSLQSSEVSLTDAVKPNAG
jgi:hypothetical protein